MKKRPTSITVLAWLIIAASSFFLILTPIALKAPNVYKDIESDPVAAQILFAKMNIGILYLLVSLASGIGLLKGKNWARIICIIFIIMGFLSEIITSATKITIGFSFLFYLIVVICLFHPNANEYFSNTDNQTLVPKE